MKHGECRYFGLEEHETSSTMEVQGLFNLSA